MNEDMLFATIHTPYEDRIPTIVDRTSSRFPVAKEVLGPILRGFMSIIEALEVQECTRYKEVLELIEYVNRRNILS